MHSFFSMMPQCTQISTSLARHSSKMGTALTCRPWAPLFLANHRSIRDDKLTHKNGRELRKKLAGGTMLWKHRHLSPSFATVIKHRTTWGKRRLQEQPQEEKRIAVACAHAKAFLNKHCPAYLVGMLKKTPALPQLRSVAESVFMLQRKWANCLCHYQNAATTSGSSSLLKFSSWKARSKEAVVWNHCIIISVHKADTHFSASLAHVVYPRPVSDVRPAQKWELCSLGGAFANKNHPT